MWGPHIKLEQTHLSTKEKVGGQWSINRYLIHSSIIIRLEWVKYDYMVHSPSIKQVQ